MFAILDFQNLDPEKTRAEIERLKNINPSCADMLQSILNKYEKQHNLPLTKIVKPVKVKVVNAKIFLARRDELVEQGLSREEASKKVYDDMLDDVEGKQNV